MAMLKPSKDKTIYPEYFTEEMKTALYRFYRLKNMRGIINQFDDEITLKLSNDDLVAAIKANRNGDERNESCADTFQETLNMRLLGDRERAVVINGDTATMIFRSKPSYEIRDVLKRGGFRWRSLAWVGKTANLEWVKSKIDL